MNPSAQLELMGNPTLRARITKARDAGLDDKTILESIARRLWKLRENGFTETQINQYLSTGNIEGPVGEEAIRSEALEAPPWYADPSAFIGAGQLGALGAGFAARKLGAPLAGKVLTGAASLGAAPAIRGAIGAGKVAVRAPFVDVSKGVGAGISEAGREIGRTGGGFAVPRQPILGRFPESQVAGRTVGPGISGVTLGSVKPVVAGTKIASAAIEDVLPAEMAHPVVEMLSKKATRTEHAIASVARKDLPPEDAAKLLVPADDPGTPESFMSLVRGTRNIVGKMIAGVGDGIMLVRDPQEVFRGTPFLGAVRRAYDAFAKETQDLSVEMSRLFPGIRRGSAKSKLYATILDDPISAETGPEAAAAIRARYGLGADETSRLLRVRAMLDDLFKRAGAKPESYRKGYITWLRKDVEFQKKIDFDDLTGIVGKEINVKYLQRRLRKDAPEDLDFVESLSAYIPAMLRKIHFDGELPGIRTELDKLSGVQRLYADLWMDRLLGRPFASDKWLRAIGQKIGIDFGSRPATKASVLAVRTIYRATMGLNIGSAVKNLTQGLNALAETGVLSSAAGAMKFIRPVGKISGDEELRLFPGMREVLRRDVLHGFNRIFEGDVVGFSRTMKWVDQVLFAPYRFSEFVNRGIAYHAGVSRAAREGLSAADRVAKGLEVSDETQFIYGVLGRSPIFQSPAGRVAGTFLTYPIKQTELLVGKTRRGIVEPVIRSFREHDTVLRAIGRLNNNEAGFVVRYLAIVGLLTAAVKGEVDLGDIFLGPVRDVVMYPINLARGRATPAPLKAAQNLLLTAANGDTNSFLETLMFNVVPGGTGIRKGVRLGVSLASDLPEVRKRGEVKRFFSMRTGSERLLRERIAHLIEDRKYEEARKLSEETGVNVTSEYMRARRKSEEVPKPINWKRIIGAEVR